MTDTPTTPSPERQPADAGGGLLPCPFCGGKGDPTSSRGGSPGTPEAGGTEWVECEDCAASGPGEPKPFTGAAWNRRTSTSQARPDAQPDARSIFSEDVGTRFLQERLVELAAMFNVPDGGRYLNDWKARADQINQALSAPAADDGWRPTHRHRGGMECEVIGTAHVQTATGLCDYDEVTIYREEDGTMWARGSDEFNDGRFTALHPAAPTDEVGKS